MGVATSSADHVGDRPGFAEMLESLLANGAKTIIVESPDRFARDLIVQLAGHDMLKARGITLVAASAPTHFVEDAPRKAGGGAQAKAHGDRAKGRGPQEPSRVEPGRGCSCKAAGPQEAQRRN
jgi:hypothetical protein